MDPDSILAADLNLREFKRIAFDAVPNGRKSKYPSDASSTVCAKLNQQVIHHVVWNLLDIPLREKVIVPVDVGPTNEQPLHFLFGMRQLTPPQNRCTVTQDLGGERSALSSV